jgi:hypothetical protein
VSLSCSLKLWPTIMLLLWVMIVILSAYPYTFGHIYSSDLLPTALMFLWCHNIQLNNIQYNNIQHQWLICDSQHMWESASTTLRITTLPLCWVSLCWVSSFIYYCAKCRYAVCHYAECRYAECCYAEWRGPFFVYKSNPS